MTTATAPSPEQGPYLAVLATAGHVDHGKTTLIRTLTGIDTDRLPEEKARGISIALGFANLALPEGRIAFVDVPGHERFLRQMLAGAGGVGGVVVVIAADEGVMPQTREHLVACELLGLRHALVVLTKVDLVAPAWLELVRDDVRQTLARTPFRDALIVPFAASAPATHAPVVTALGALARAVCAGHRAPADRPFALPIDRVFTVHGFGTVVTGTSIAGRLATQSEVEWLPRGTRARIRGLERFGVPVDAVGPGERVAVNLQGVAPDAIAVGDLLTTPGALAAVQSLDVTLRVAPGATLARKTAAVLHLGTTSVAATIVRLEPHVSAADPDAEPLTAQLHLARPVALWPGMPFVLRGFERRPEAGTIVAGGRAWLPSVRRAQARSAAIVVATLRAVLADDAASAITHYLAQHGESGAARSALATLLPFSAARIADHLARLIASGAVVAAADRVYAASALAALDAAATRILAEHHAADPSAAGLRLDELATRARASAPLALIEALSARAVAAKRWIQDAALVRLASHRPSGHDDPIASAIAELLTRAELAPPRPDELAAPLATLGHKSTKAAIDAALRQLVAADRLVRVTADLIVARSALSAFEGRVRAHFEQAETLDAQDLKALTGASRRFAIPLGEWLDRARITYRTGDVRRLRGR